MSIVIGADFGTYYYNNVEYSKYLDNYINKSFDNPKDNLYDINYTWYNEARELSNKKLSHNPTYKTIETMSIGFAIYCIIMLMIITLKDKYENK